MTSRCPTRLSASILLSLSLIAQPLTAHAEQQLSASDVAVDQIIHAMEAPTNANSGANLQSAESKLLNDAHLRLEDVQQISGLLSRAFARASTMTTVRLDKADPGGDNSESTAPVSKAIESPNAADFLNRNPDLRAALLAISQAEVTRDASNVSAAIQAETGESLAERDAEEAAQEKVQQEPGNVVQLMGELGAYVPVVNMAFDLKDIHEKNQALQRQNENTPIEDLANQIIIDHTTISAVSGVSRSLLYSVGGPALQGIAQKFGIGIEGAATALINIHLILSLVDLYGLEASKYDQEILAAAVFAGAKATGQIGFSSTKAVKFLEHEGRLLVDVHRSIHSGAKVEFRAVLDRLIRGTFVRGAAKAAAQQDAAAHAVRTGRPVNEDVLSDQKLTAIRGVTIQERAKIVASRFVGHIVSAGFSGVETLGVGMAAKWLLDGARRRERELDNQDFNNFLLQPRAMGFFKFMIVSINDGEALPPIKDLENSNDKRTRFILNLARSAKICSPRALAAFASARQRQLDPGKQLAFTCDSNLGTSDFTTIEKEFTTFREIPTASLTSLRLVERNSRLRMAELLIQMQFLNGDPSQADVDYRKHVIRNILGFTSHEDDLYFEHFMGFIRLNGGLSIDADSPTGWTIAKNSKENPYDMATGGYTTTSAPTPPSPHVPQPVVTKK